MPLPGQTQESAPVSSANRPELTAEKALADAIRRRFEASKISSNNFTVRVIRKKAIIEGSTDIIQHKGVATRLARLAGAESVDNRIEISKRARDKANRRRRESARHVRVEWREATRSERR